MSCVKLSLIRNIIDNKEYLAKFLGKKNLLNHGTNMVRDEEIKVASYSGYKANERPLYFFLDGKRIGIREIIKQWRDPEYDCYRVHGTDQNHYILKWLRSKDQWFVERKNVDR